MTPNARGSTSGTELTGTPYFRAQRDQRSRTLTIMRAAVITSPGMSPRTIDYADPVDVEGRENVTVTAAAIPPVELLIASGTTYFGVPPCPYIPGLHGTGTTADGRPILFATSAGMFSGEGGSMAEHCAVDLARTLELPDIDVVVAAALANPAPAALGALARGRLVPGETVIVLGASGLVGQIAVQAAHAAGARVVAVARGAHNRERALTRGADAAIDSADIDVDQLAASLLEATDGGAQLVIDPVAGMPALAATRALAPGGRLVNLGDSAAAMLSLPSALVRSRGIDVLGFSTVSLGWPGQSALLQQAFDMARNGTLGIDIEKVPLDDAESAWDRMSAGTVGTRLVLIP